MTKILEIDACLRCAHCADTGNEFFCQKADEEILQINTIPDWCPLPDKPEPITARILEAPCCFCGYNGPGYYQPHTHDKLCPWYEIGGGEERKHALIVFAKKRFLKISYSNKPEPITGEWLIEQIDKILEEINKLPNIDELEGYELEGINMIKLAEAINSHFLGDNRKINP